MARRLRLFRAEEEAEVGKLQEFGGEEIGSTAKEDEGDRSGESNGDGSAEGMDEVHASE